MKILALVTIAACTARAQSLPPVHPITAVQAITTEPLVSVSQVRELPGGRVIVNDLAGRRVLMFDSTLKSFTAIADTTPATGNMYASTFAGIVSYHGDSTLFVDPVTVSMFLIDGSGKVVRTMAAPPRDDATYLVGGPYGTPGTDSRGRLVYRARVGGLMMIINAPRPGEPPPPPQRDSSMVMRMTFSSRARDTVAKFEVPFFPANIVRDDNGHATLTTVINPIPWIDDWALMSDGRVAVVHGREFRVDYFDEDEKLIVSAKIPFDWQPLSDSAKSALLDSVRAARAPELAAQARADSLMRLRRMPDPANAVRAPAGLTPARAGGTVQTDFVPINELPDYRPPFQRAAARGDLAGNLWVRTTKIENGGAVYDVIDPKGKLIDRVAVPAGRVIAGFGRGGVVYMGVLDGTVARLERARVALAGVAQ
ncbi:MAG: hypothetical protein ACREN6_04010 [Gemmatimonadaceae bacterium]